MAPVLNYTPGIVKKSFVSNGLPEDRTQSMLNLVYARCESGGVDVWTNISSPPSFTYETTEKTRLHGLFRDLTLKEWQSVFHVVAVVNS